MKFFPTDANVTIDATTSNGEDAGNATGSSIANSHRTLLNNVWTSGSEEIRIDIKSREKVSRHARLSTFGLSGASLSKTFVPANENYRTDVTDNSVTQVTLNASPEHSSAGYRYLDANDTPLVYADTADDFQVDIAPGDTVVKVVVTAEDGTTTKTYSVALLRKVLNTEERENCGGSRDNSCEVVTNEDAPVYGTIDSEGQEDWIDVVLEPRNDYVISVHQGRQLGSNKLRCRTLDIYGPSPNYTRVGGFTIDSEGQEDWIDVVLEPRNDYVISVHQGRQLGSNKLA